MDRDEAYAQVVAILFGDGAPEHIAKSASLDTSTKAKHNTAMTANTVATIGGVHALALAGKELKSRAKGKMPEIRELPKAGRLKALRSVPVRAGNAIASHPKLAAGAAAGWVGLHGFELYGDLAGRQALKANKPKDVHVEKSSPDGADLHAMGSSQPRRRIPRSKGELTLVAAAKSGPYVARGAKATGRGAVQGGKYVKDVAVDKTPVVLDKTRKFKEKIAKADALDVTWEGEFSKFDTDKRQVFGWASIVEVNGEPVVDLQGDYITPDEIEKAAYEYVKKSRKGGDMHERDGEAPLHVSDMIESFVVTDEKKKLLGLPDSMPTGWWCGFQVNDDATWDKVKKGERKGFSIHGRGKRVPVDA